MTTNDGSYTDSCSVTVNAKVINVTGVSLNKNSLELVEEDTETLTATVSPSDATNKNVTWSTENSGIATVSDGVVTAVSAGNTTITVTTEDGSYTDTCSVTVTEKIINVESVSLDKTSITLTEEDTEQLTATVSPENATDTSVTWSTENSSIATVSQDGLVTAVGAGTTTITVTTTDSSKTDTCVVTVNAKTVSVDSVSLNKNTLELEEGASETLIATVSPANATNQNVTWSTESETIATVSNGLVTAVAEGSTTITVTTEDGGKTDTCSVTVTAVVNDG